MVSLLERFNILAKITTRRKKVILYVKSAEKIADFLRLIEADQAVLKFENIRISRDFSNSLQRMNNMDLANEVKAVAAASGQLDDIRILEENQKIETLDRKLQDIIALRKANPEASLMELCSIYERQTGEIVSKSGMKHRFVKIHELAMKEVKQDEQNTTTNSGIHNCILGYRDVDIPLPMVAHPIITITNCRICDLWADTSQKIK